MRKISLLPLTLTLVVSAAALAEDKYSADYTACTRTATDTASLTDCNGAELQKQNKRLNEALKWATAALPEEKQKILQHSQALWEKLKDSDCGLYYSLTGGTADLINGSSCELDMTRERASSLEFIADNGGEIGGE